MQHNSMLAPPSALATCSIPILPVHARTSRSGASSSESTASSLLVCVEYPGFVQSIPNALKQCKGEDSIRKLLPVPSAASSVSPDSLLKLYLRPDDPTAPPLFGEVAHDLHRKPHASTTHATVHKDDADTAAGRAAGQTTTESFYEFVVKVTKKKKNRAPAHSAATSSAAAAASTLSAELLGLISTSVTFPGLCDFQLLHAQRTPIVQMEMPLLTQPLDTHAAAAARASDPPGDPLCFLPNHPGDLYALAPMIFSRYDYARDYGFAHHENTSAAAKSMQASVPFKLKAREDESGEEKEGASAAAVQPPQLSGKKRARKSAPAAASASSSHAAPASSVSAVPAVAAADDSEAEGAGGGDDDEDDDAAAEAGELSEAGEKGGHVKRGRQARRFFITFATPTPAGPTAAELQAPELQSKPLVAQLRAIFEERAICSTDYLLVKIAEDRARALQDDRKQTGDLNLVVPAAPAAGSAELSRSDLLHHLPCVAYRFSGGPWRNLWLRYGFDPRLPSLAAEARRMQVVDYRVPRKLFEEIAEKQGQSTTNTLHAIKKSHPSGGTGPAPMEEDAPAAAAASSSARSVSPAPLSAMLSSAPLPVNQLDLHFDRMPLRLHSKFQLLDLHGEEIQQIVNNSQLESACDKDRGWYLNTDLSSIRRLMTSRMHGWCVEQGLASSSLLHTAAAASGKSKHSKRTLGRSFAAASFSVNNPMAATERQFKRSQKTAETKRKKKAAAEAQALATGIPVPAPVRKKRKKKGDADAVPAAPVALSPAVAASVSAESVRAAAVVAHAAETLRMNTPGGVRPVQLTVPADTSVASAAVYPLTAASRPVFDVVHAAPIQPQATSAAAATTAALSEGDAEEEDEEDDDDDEGMEEEE